MTPEKVLQAMADAAQTIMCLKEGRYIEAAAHAADLVLDIVPGDHAKKVLDDAIFRRVQNEAAATEQLKFGG